MAKIHFDIKYRDKIESGEYKVETRSGKTARVVCWDRVGTQLVVLVGKDEDVLTYNPDGTTGQQMQLRSDLFIITPEPEFTEFEKKLWEVLKSEGSPIDPIEKFTNSDKEVFHSYAAKLLSLARDQFIKDGYVIEKKAFHDAVENISDKHLAEMSIQYSLHCKVQDGTRHAVMNWSKFQKLAQKFIDIGKEEALKDLPRWERTTLREDASFLGCRNEDELFYKGRVIALSELEKLPGFKEDNNE